MGRERVDTVVIGAGVIGLAAARALALAGREVLVLEANAGIGQETSSRSSEVIHAGLHYPPGSLKALTCVRGKQMLYDYCAAKGVPHRALGKLIVATRAERLPELARIRDNAIASGVADVTLIGRERLAAMEPQVRGEAALWSPSTGIIDSHGLMLALQADLEAAGGIVALESRVAGVRASNAGFALRVAGASGFELSARQLINAAGLGAADLARRITGLPAACVPRVHLVRGHYFAYAGTPPFSTLVYPLPEADGLGVHATLDLAGQMRFGPDAEYANRVDYAFDHRRLGRFAAAIRPWYPALDAQRLQPGYVGIRPRLAGPGEGFRDFVISGPAEHGVPGLVNLYGIESPGLTACLALAADVARAAA